MKNKLKKIILFIISLIYLITYTKSVEADVGSFESYSGGSSGGSSSWSRGSSSSSRRGSSYSTSSGDADFEDLIWGIVIVIVIVLVVSKSRGGKNNKDSLHQVDPQGLSNEQRELQVVEKIKQIDPLFNKEDFIVTSKNLFIKLQQAWTDRNWSIIRVFETNELFEQHKNQLQGYIDNNQINVMDRICVNYAYLYDFIQEGDKDILKIRLNSRMADYIIDATTKEVIKGDKQTERTNTYILTFVRKKGLQTKEGTDKINTTNCPNCGAPTQITSSGECEYCGSVITTGEYNWVLSNLERERI